jgi:hypothetical protein
MIVTCWTATLRESFDWGERPLSRYEFGERFLQDLDEHHLGETALLCAMVACGRAVDLKGYRIQRRLEPARNPSPVRRGDRAQAWRCVHHIRASRATLNYWVLQSGDIEFESLQHYHPRLLAARTTDDGSSHATT